jgi:hypothetical protein
VAVEDPPAKRLGHLLDGVTQGFPVDTMVVTGEEVED